MVLKHLHEYQIYRIFAPSRFICTCVVTSAKIWYSIIYYKHYSIKYYLQNII